MRIFVLLLAFVLVSGDELAPLRRPTSPPPESPAEIWHLTLPDAIRRGLDDPTPVTQFIIGGQVISPSDFELPRMPQVPKPGSGRNDDSWDLSLPEVIRIGLDNSGFVRVNPPVDSSTSELEIEPIDPDTSLWTFQAEAMALVRTIERSYGELYQDQAIVEARGVAVQQAEEVRQLERNELEQSRSNSSPIEVIERTVEDLQHAQHSAITDLIRVEQELRQILGLELSDGRRITAITPPVEAKVSPDWDSAVHEMNESQPDIAREKILARLFELRLLLARNQLVPRLSPDECYRIKALGAPKAPEPAVEASPVLPLPGSLPEGPKPTPPATVVRPWIDFPAVFRRTADQILEGPILTPLDLQGGDSRQVGLTLPMPNCFGRGPLASVRQAQYQARGQWATLRAVTNQATDSLSKFYHEIEANHDRYTLDRQASLEARDWREARYDFYREGRINAAQMLEAIQREANTTSAAARSLAAYNASLVTFEEAKGRTLEFEGIRLAGSPRTAPIADPLSAGSHRFRLIPAGLARSTPGFGTIAQHHVPF